MPPKRRNPRRPQNRRKKVYKQKQAYKPRQKRKMKMMRQPFVETKKVSTLNVQDHVANELVTPADVTAAQYRQWKNVNMSPTSQFLFMARGTGPTNIIGRDIYSKYLKQKIEITLPTGVPPDTTNPGATPLSNRSFHRITQPVQFWVVWGWIKKPIGHENDVDGTDITTADIIAEIDRITEDGNRLLGNVQTRNSRDSDFLTFKDRRKNIWTMEKRLLRPSQTPTSVKTPMALQQHQIYQTDFANPPGDDPGEGHPRFNKSDWGQFFANDGYPNVLQTTISWKTNRKMRFFPDDDSAGGGGFARDSWLPYSYICVPKQFQDGCNKASPATYEYGSASGGDLRQYYDLVGEIKVNASMCHWFTDS